ncbi:NUDIX hydrolase [Hoyosella subflava]|uniref:NUDIX hydrolase n=1 Tax=Hoyosella subflava TaxID=639313 RepID=UPI00059EBB92|nr:bifunctional NUDIX hydrolase/histidine phosphatase family protein [Hoyosella subflava]
MSVVSTKRSKSSVLAAGAVLWRRNPKARGGVEVAVIHRPRYDDWSLPKGKLDAGETPVVAAAREIAEETGFIPRLGRHLIRVSYPLTDARRKEVDYWSAEALSGEFTPNGEVDELIWVPLAKAPATVTYNLDRRVLKKFAELSADVTTLLVIRHGKAGRRGDFPEDDNLRPLDATGRAQAEALVPHLLAYGVTDVHSADRTRCIQTVAPTADELGNAVVVEPTMSEEEYVRKPKASNERLLEISRLPGVHAVCSQGGVIPGLLDWLAKRSSITLPPAKNRKGSLWALTMLDGRLLSADYLDSPLGA